MLVHPVPVGQGLGIDGVERRQRDHVPSSRAACSASLGRRASRARCSPGGHPASRARTRRRRGAAPWPRSQELRGRRDRRSPGDHRGPSRSRRLRSPCGSDCAGALGHACRTPGTVGRRPCRCRPGRRSRRSCPRARRDWRCSRSRVARRARWTGSSSRRRASRPRRTRRSGSRSTPLEHVTVRPSSRCVGIESIPVPGRCIHSTPCASRSSKSGWSNQIANSTSPRTLRSKSAGGPTVTTSASGAAARICSPTASPHMFRIRI